MTEVEAEYRETEKWRDEKRTDEEIDKYRDEEIGK